VTGVEKKIKADSIILLRQGKGKKIREKLIA
jgi:hypothetical protein